MTTAEKDFGVTKKNNYFLFLPPPRRRSVVDVLGIFQAS